MLDEKKMIEKKRVEPIFEPYDDPPYDGKSVWSCGGCYAIYGPEKEDEEKARICSNNLLEDYKFDIGDDVLVLSDDGKGFVCKSLDDPPLWWKADKLKGRITERRRYPIGDENGVPIGHGNEYMFEITMENTYTPPYIKTDFFLESSFEKAPEKETEVEKAVGK